MVFKQIEEMSIKMTFTEILRDEGVKKIVVMPDSLISKCIDLGQLEQQKIDYIQVLNESEAVCICSGLNLTGVCSVCIMENSGIRSACDIISRFELAHGIHNIFILTNRGEVGEENWWGIYHNEVTIEILRTIKIKTISVATMSEFQWAVHNAIKTFKTEQTSIAILLEYSFFEGIL